MSKLNFLCPILFCFVISAEDAPTPSTDKTAPVPNPNLPGGDWTLKGVGRNSPLFINGQIVRPAGQTFNVSGSPRSLAIARNGRFLIAKTSNALAVVDAETFKLIKQYEIPDGGSMHGLAVSADGTMVCFSTKLARLFTATLAEDGALTFAPSIELRADKDPICPLGVALTQKDGTALVALSISNQLGIVDLATRQVTARVDVGVCPFGVVATGDGQTAFVSNFGGPRARRGDKTEKSAGTEVALDARSVALRGSVSVIDLATAKVVGEIETRIHPEAMVLSPDNKTLYVVDASGDGIAVIDVAQRKSIKQLNTKPRADLPYGSLTDGLAVSADGKTLYAANAGNNAIALIDPKGDAGAPFGLIPTGAFPGTVCLSGNALFVGNVEGFGGDLQKTVLPSTGDELKKLTAAAEAGFHYPEILRTMTRARSNIPPVPVPVNPGEPSTLKHVVYIIKENKKFDQVLGDLGKGNCEPKFCEFGRETTPNAHALAEQFVLLDNYYCCSGNSARGHQWAVQGLISPYRAKGDKPRVSYDFGVDPLAYAGCGFIWDHVLRQGISFRNFGELDYPITPKGSSWTDYYKDWKSRAGQMQFECDYKVDVLRTYSDKRFPGWEMNIPDQLRVDVFLTALKEYETAGQLPAFIIIYLPNDHTEGTRKNSPTPRAYVADNDLAFGRIVEALSKSKFWNDMLIIANEDDPQTGADHVSGYRSVCYIASPYAKRKALISHFYNQASVLHTICSVLGIPPMNQMVASSPLMTECFQAMPDLAPYECIQAKIALDEMNPGPKTPKQAQLFRKIDSMDFSAPDLLNKQDNEIFSRLIWSSTKGTQPFPVKYWGPHGNGLAALGLSLESIGAEADDDD